MRIVLGITIALLVAMWIYAFFFASKDPAYRVDDAAWRERAEGICARYQAERLELVDTSDGFIADPTDEQILRRAGLVEQATDLLEAQLAEVTAAVPASERDRSLIRDYTRYWNLVLADRRAYVERLRALELTPYYETAVEGTPVTNVLIDFSTANLMPSCSPPNELGTG